MGTHSSSSADSRIGWGMHGILSHKQSVSSSRSLHCTASRNAVCCRYKRIKVIPLVRSRSLDAARQEGFEGSYWRGGGFTPSAECSELFGYRLGSPLRGLRTLAQEGRNLQALLIWNRHVSPIAESLVRTWASEGRDCCTIAHRLWFGLRLGDLWLLAWHYQRNGRGSLFGIAK